VVDSKKRQKFVTSLANDINDETPWQKLNDGKQTFLRSYHITVLLSPVLRGCIHSPTSTGLVL